MNCCQVCTSCTIGPVTLLAASAWTAEDGDWPAEIGMEIGSNLVSEFGGPALTHVNPSKMLGPEAARELDAADARAREIARSEETRERQDAKDDLNARLAARKAEVTPDQRVADLEAALATVEAERERLAKRIRVLEARRPPAAVRDEPAAEDDAAPPERWARARSPRSFHTSSSFFS